MGAVVVVVVGVVVLVAAVVGDAALVDPPPAAGPVAEVALPLPLPPEELPQAASSTTSGSRTRRFMSTVSLGTRWDACHYPDGHGP